MLYKNTLAVKKARPSWKYHLMFNICLSCSYMRLKGLISGRGQGLMRFNHFMQLFIITCKQTAGIIVANNNLLELQ